VSDGHGDRAARRSHEDLPDIDLPCPLFMILADLDDVPRFLSVFLAFPVSAASLATDPPQLTPFVGRTSEYISKQLLSSL
jgi:hypothetical protein